MLGSDSGNIMVLAIYIFPPYGNLESMTPCSEKSGSAPSNSPNNSKGMGQPLFNGR